MGKVNRYALPLVLLLLSSIVSPCLGLQGSQSIPSYGTIRVYSNMMKLHVEGTKIVDELGREVRLIGFNVFGKWNDWRRELDEWNCVPPPSGVRIGERGDDMLWMRAHGFNLVRAIMFWEFMEPTEGVYNEAFFGYLDEFLDACEDHGLYVLLDMHQWMWSSHFPSGGYPGRGFPHWVVNSYPATRAGSHDFAMDFLTNRGAAAAARSKFVDMWKYIANRYRDRKYVIYDLLNEPWSIPGRTDPEEEDAIRGYCDFFNNEVAPAIRTIDPSTMIVYPAYSWVTPLKKQTVGNVAWLQSMYKYSYEDLGRPYDPVVDGPKIRELLETWQYKIEIDFGAPCIIGEVGGDWSKENNLVWLDNVLKIEEEVLEGAHWNVWHYGKHAKWEPWLPRYDWGHPPIKDMPMVAVLDNHTF